MTDEQIKESMLIRGLASSILAMNFPTIASLNHLLSKIGYKLIKL